MDSEKEREMLKEREAKRLLRKRKATISEEQPSKKPKLRTETIDELINKSRKLYEKDANHGMEVEDDNETSITLEELVPSLWIESECEYDISDVYGIFHWWFKRKEFYITRHSSPRLIAVESDPHADSAIRLHHSRKSSSVRVYRDTMIIKKMMRETEVNKFSDGTLNRILDKMDHMVKDFKLFKYNLSMETRIWSKDDIRRS
ncbi:hypothetical protein Tco_0661871 [Tanacetum coccineum]